MKDLKPDNILIALPDAEETIRQYTAQASQSEQPGGVAAAAVRESSLPLILSRPIIPFSPDDLRSENYLKNNFEVQLTDFGTGE